MEYRGKIHPERMEGESEEQFTAFLYYLDIKSLKQMSQINCGYSERQLYNISKKYNWKERYRKYHHDEKLLMLNSNKRRLQAALQKNTNDYIDLFENNSQIVRHDTIS